MEVKYTVEETAKLLFVKVRTIRLWVKQGKLKAIKIGRRLLINESEIKRLLKE